jgi:dUTP pyrophosphatase
MLVNKSNNPSPAHQTTLSIGFDIASNEELVLHPGQRYAVSTGLYLDHNHPIIARELERGVILADQGKEVLELQIRPRSGMALNHGVTVLNSPGTVDIDYKGEIKVILVNLSDKDYHISVGQNIAQGVFATGHQLLPIINRIRTGGFGSTNS